MKADSGRKGRRSPPDEITSLGSNVVEAPEDTQAHKRTRTEEGAKSAGPRSGWDVGGGERRDGGDAAGPSTSRHSGLQRALPASRASPSGKDKDGHLIYELGQRITPQYKILSKLGEGTFGQVLECWDREKKQYVALKVIRNVPKYREAAYIEIEILQRVEKQDLQGKRHCVQLAHFEYKGHVCMVFQRLGMSLYDFLRRNHYQPFKIDLVRDFARQMLKSVAFLHKMKLTHTDLKPENILLVSNDYTTEPATTPGGHSSRVPVSSKIKLIDFGNATFHDQYHCSVVSTRHYRAPEVILGLKWSYPCDMWSVGCILVELLTGEALFQTHDNLEHLAMMEAVIGPLPTAMIRQADRSASKYFRGDGLCWPPPDGPRDSISAVRRMAPLKEILAKVDRSEAGLLLTDLLRGVLKYDPKERMTAIEALGHGFFEGGDGRNTSDGSVGGHDGGGGGRGSVADGGEAEGASSRGPNERSM